MSQRYSAAKEDLRKKLKELEEEVIWTKNAINMLQELEGKPPVFTEQELNRSSKGIRPDQYYGRPFATVVREYLEFVGSACSASQIIEGLTEGGFDFKAHGWEGKGLLRTISMMLGKNNRTFHKIQSNNTFGLLSWYPEIENKIKKAKIQESDINEEENNIESKLDEKLLPENDEAS